MSCYLIVKFFIEKNLEGFFLQIVLFIWVKKKNLTDLSFKLFEKEYNIIKNYLPNKTHNIMDVGCGLGIINIFIQQHYKNNLKYFLIDKNKIDLKIKYGFQDNYESYNDLLETKKLLNSNGIKNENIFMIDAEKQIVIDQKIDFVISLKSMGYHYPYEMYLSLLKKVASDNCTFIFDLASKKYKDLETIKKHFREYRVIFEEDSIHPLKRVVLKGLITSS